MENPHIGVNGQTWREAPKVTLCIDGENSVIVEAITKDGSAPVVTIKAFTPLGAADEQAVLDETRFT